MRLVAAKHLQSIVDYGKLQKAVSAMTGVPTYVMPGPPPPGSYNTEEAGLEEAKTN